MKGSTENLYMVRAGIPEEVNIISKKQPESDSRVRRFSTVKGIAYDSTSESCDDDHRIRVVTRNRISSLSV